MIETIIISAVIIFRFRVVSLTLCLRQRTLKFTPLQNNENCTRNHNDQRNRQWSRRIARVHAEDRRSIHDGRKARTVKQ